MRHFAALLDRLVFTPGRNDKLRLLVDYFRAVPDPDRGQGLAALTGRLELSAAKPALIRGLVETRVDPVLFAWSYDYVGDLAETVALIWPERPGGNRPPELSEVVARLSLAGRSEVPGIIEAWLDVLDATGRWALLKLITGGLRVGVSARLTKTALAQLAAGEGEDHGPFLNEIEEIWHGIQPPFETLFAWLEGRAAKPIISARSAFRPLMLAQPLEAGELEKLRPQDFRAEWKWDGIRVQLSADGTAARLFSRGGEDISKAFPDLLEATCFDAVLDGELLVVRDERVAPFNDLQQRLNRKSVSAKLQSRYPAHLRIYDLLFDGAEDLREMTFLERRGRLEDWFAAVCPAYMDLSPLVDFTDWPELEARRQAARENGIEGLMLKRAAGPYLAGRPKGHWFKWKRDALTLDTVLMYAQRGHGKRSSFYSDYTFGAWRMSESGEAELVPVGKAYFGFTDEELKRLDKWVRDNTVERFGPVRAVRPGLVLEVAFDAVQRSTRHKSGIALRFPRVHRIRWDKPPAEADYLVALERLILE